MTTTAPIRTSAAAACLTLLSASSALYAQAEDCPGGPLILPAGPAQYILDDTTTRLPSGTPDCAGTVTGIADSWFQVRGTGRGITITTCPGVDPGAFAQYNTVISVYCASCSISICVAESAHTCGVQPQAATVRWCSNPGEIYYVRVHGDGGTNEGQFRAAIYDTGPCTSPVDCSAISPTTGAKHVVTFDNEPLGLHYGGNPPNTLVLTEDNIDVYTDLLACSGFYGDAVIENVPPVAGFGAGHFPQYFAFGLEFDFSNLPGPVDHVEFEFAHQGNEVGLDVNGVGVVCSQAFRFLPNPNLTVNDAPFGLGFNDFWGRAQIDGDVQNLRIFGDELFIDNVCVVLRAPRPCPADIDGNGTTNVQDLLLFLSRWFALDPSADFNNDTVVDVQDLLEMLSYWFPASNGDACP